MSAAPTVVVTEPAGMTSKATNTADIKIYSGNECWYHATLEHSKKKRQIAKG